MAQHFYFRLSRTVEVHSLRLLHARNCGEESFLCYPEWSGPAGLCGKGRRGSGKMRSPMSKVQVHSAPQSRLSDEPAVFAVSTVRPCPGLQLGGPTWHPSRTKDRNLQGPTVSCRHNWTWTLKAKRSVLFQFPTASILSKNPTKLKDLSEVLENQ